METTISVAVDDESVAGVELRAMRRIEKTVSVADDDESVAGVVLRAIRVIENRVDLVDALSRSDASANRLTLVDLLLQDLREILATTLHQILRIGNDADTRDVVFERYIPEPATATRLSTQNERGAAV